MPTLVSRARGTRSSNDFCLLFQLKSNRRSVSPLSGVRWLGQRVEDLMRSPGVTGHLLDQGICCREALFTAQAAHKLDAQAFAVQVTVEVEQVHLEDTCAVSLERRTDAE